MAGCQLAGHGNRQKLATLHQVLGILRCISDVFNHRYKKIGTHVAARCTWMLSNSDFILRGLRSTRHRSHHQIIVVETSHDNLISITHSFG